MLGGLLHALIHKPDQVKAHFVHTVDYLAGNATRAHPARDKHKGRLKLGLEHVYGNP